jgi:hypothetical protein
MSASFGIRFEAQDEIKEAKRSAQIGQVYLMTRTSKSGRRSL